MYIQGFNENLGYMIGLNMFYLFKLLFFMIIFREPGIYFIYKFYYNILVIYFYYKK